MAVITVPALRDFAIALLDRGGFGAALAAEMADLLLWANLRGADSHGVLRIPRYVEMLETGLVHSDFTLAKVHEQGAVCVLDAGKAPGAVAMNRAVAEAADLASRFGLGWCAVRCMSHAGAIGYFAEQLATRGLIGVVTTASIPLMAYHGARGAVLSTNPLAIGVPTPEAGRPILLDMSTAAVALGKIMAARDAGEAIAPGLAVDADGMETTDPRQVAAILPMAGAKGSGLSLMIEILCSLLVDNPNIAPALTGGKTGGFNGMVLAIDPAAFGVGGSFLAHVGDLAAAIHGLPPAAGVDHVRLPGERGHDARVAAETGGITLATGTVRRLVALAAKLDVAIPAAFA